MLSGHKGHVRVKSNSLNLSLCRAALIIECTSVTNEVIDTVAEAEDVF